MVGPVVLWNSSQGFVHCRHEAVVWCGGVVGRDGGGGSGRRHVLHIPDTTRAGTPAHASKAGTSYSHESAGCDDRVLPTVTPGSTVAPTEDGRVALDVDERSREDRVRRHCRAAVAVPRDVRARYETDPRSARRTVFEDHGATTDADVAEQRDVYVLADEDAFTPFELAERVDARLLRA